MIKKCFCCGVEKDLSIKTIYPYEEDLITTESLVSQLFTIECEDEETQEFRMVVMCHQCWHKLETNDGIDMWIGKRSWESLDPIIPFYRLPEIVREYDDGKWDAENYTPLD